MAIESTDLRPYKPFNKKSTVKRRPRESATNLSKPRLEWKRFKIAQTGIFPGPVVSVRFSRSVYNEKGQNQTSLKSPYLVIAGSTRIDILSLDAVINNDNETQLFSSVKHYSKFKKTIECFCIRHDEQIICATDNFGFTQVFDVATNSQLRLLKHPDSIIKACAFSGQTNVYCLLGSDDGILSLWDISDGQCVCSIKNTHQDSITCLASEPNKNMVCVANFASGGADGYIKLWKFDLHDKQNITGECNLVLKHGDFITALAYFPQGGLLTSSGGVDVKIWDITTGQGKLLHTIQAHVKVVTALSVAHDGSYIITGSIDQKVKFLCPSRGVILHTITCDDAVTSVDSCFGFDGELVAIGTADGKWTLRFWLSQPSENVISKKQRMSSNLSDGRFFKRGLDSLPCEDDIIITSAQTRRFDSFDRLLQAFKHQALLDHAVKHDLFSTAENSWIYRCKDFLVIQALQRLSSKLDIDISEHQLLRETSGLIELIQVLADTKS